MQEMRAGRPHDSRRDGSAPVSEGILKYATPDK